MRLPKLRRKVGRIAYSLHGIVLTWRTAPALVHANDYNTMWVGVASKLLRGSRLVYDAHELWPDQGLAEWRPRQLACEWLFVRVADANVAANPGIAETMARRYRIAAPIVVRNVPEHVLETSPRAEGLRAGKSPMAVHVGGLVPERGLELTIQALALVPRLRLRFIGTGSEEYRAELEECAKVAGVAERIEFRPPVEPDAIVDTISGADLGVLLTQPTCLNNVRSLPNKLFEYAAAGLPIVASDLPVIAEIVDGAGIGETVPPADVGAIADAMRRIAEPTRNAALRKQVSAFARSVTWSSERKVLEGVYAALSLD
jgi:glycosyltransferase involved in cell wall biosynthesis